MRARKSRNVCISNEHALSSENTLYFHYELQPSKTPRKSLMLDLLLN